MDRFYKYILASLAITSVVLFILFETWFAFFAIPDTIHDTTSIQLREVLDRNGVPLREALSERDGRGRWIPLDQISSAMITATVMAEDQRFYSHLGVDLLAVARALKTNIQHGRIVSGGSTITQQLVRILDPRPRTYLSKFIEALIAIRIELSYTKNDILKQYLNRAPYGGHIVGVEAASRIYFQKPARDLSPSEAAYLAIIPRAPTFLNPHRNSEQLIGRQRLLLEQLFNETKLSKGEFERATFNQPNIASKDFPFRAPHFSEWVLRLTTERSVKTSLDFKLQRRVEEIIRGHLQTLDQKNVTNAAAIILDNATGEILAMAGSGNYSNRGRDGNVNGALALRQPGSALKPFTYALALENGWTTSTIIPDIERHFPTEHGDYSPRNYDGRFRGPVRLRMALANSLNVPAVYLLSKLGAENLLHLLKDLGFSHLEESIGHYGLGLTLGNGEVTLLELAGAFSALARGGNYLSPSPFLKETVSRGDNVLSGETSYIISDILSDDNARRMGFGEESPLNLPFRVAAKTGTSKNFRDNWTIGYTPEITVAVWAGNFDGAGMRGVSGISGAGPIFKDLFQMVAESRDFSWFDEPETIVHQTICPFSGRRLSNDCHTGIDEIFVSDHRPHDNCDFHVTQTIDTRNGLLAGNQCDAEWTEMESFIYLPHIYYNWATTHQVRLAPERYSPLCPAQVIDSKRKIVATRITHPNDKSTYAIDPYIPLRLQRLDLQAEGSSAIDWFIDDKKIASTTTPHSTSWQLTPGRHTISIASRNSDQQDAIRIQVYE